ncbi:hypothetical protein [Streptomyces sp. NPDC003015]
MTATVFASVSGLSFTAVGQGEVGVVAALAAGLLFLLRDRFDLFNGSAE